MGISKRFNGTQLEQELTKPCPLMPDGEWVKAVIKVIYDEDTETYSHTFESTSPYITDYSNDSSIIAISCLNTTPYKFAEVRMTFDTTEPLTTSIEFQTSHAWSVTTQGTQVYWAIAYSSQYGRQRGTSTYTFYAYIVPKDD